MPQDDKNSHRCAVVTASLPVKKAAMSGKVCINALLITFLACVSGAIGLDVRYEPSEPEVVDKMLSMAEVTDEDVVYDLGCGDGRIVITAAKMHGALGVGIDLDPERIAESKENSRKAGVTDKVTFIEQNLYEADIDEATAVMLFLWPSVNLKLRPKLLNELAPGTRIVSHEHTMGEWAPDLTEEVEADGRHHMVHLWILPANVSGIWEWVDRSDSGEKNCRMQIEQSYQSVTATLYVGGTVLPVTEAVLKGNRLSISFEETTGGQTATLTLDGFANGNVLRGIMISKTETGSVQRVWTAERQPSSIVPFE